MKCPRCTYECDVRQAPCPRCGLHIRMPGWQGSASRLVPIKDSSVDDVRSPSMPDNKNAPILSNHPLAATHNQTQILTYSHDLQLDKFPVTEGLRPKKTLSPAPAQSHTLSTQEPSITNTRPGTLSGSRLQVQQLLPGTLLHRDRYSLQKKLQQQEWPLKIVETVWAASDTRVAKSAVIIYELSVPDDAPAEAQAIPHTATKIFTSIGRHLYILPLRDVFSANGHSFFVFEFIDGTPLSTLMLNNGGKLSEQEAITPCLQITELLDMCSRQSPPLIHGNIRPEYIVKKFSDSQYVLTNFSVALAGGLVQVVTMLENAQLISSSISDQLKRKMDVRTDLYQLLAVVHYVVVGYGSFDPNTKIAGSDLSPQLHAILLKGLHAPLPHRYQTPAELYRDLQALRHMNENVFRILPSTTGGPGKSPFTPIPQIVSSEHEQENFISTIQPVGEPIEDTLLVPLPEELPPLKDAHDMRNATLWFAAMLLCFILMLGHSLL